mmetsp:Transcript_451/g.1280  ORF Transcript_451/g.1280 Transcript_451/m.1280 type:complete len:221 (-) Transcript_451:5098-5760(-)
MHQKGERYVASWLVVRRGREVHFLWLDASEDHVHTAWIRINHGQLWDRVHHIQGSLQRTEQVLATPLFQRIGQVGTVHVFRVVANVHSKALHKVAVVLERESGVDVVQSHVNPSNHELVLKGLELELLGQGEVTDGVRKVFDSRWNLQLLFGVGEQLFPHLVVPNLAWVLHIGVQVLQQFTRVCFRESRRNLGSEESAQEGNDLLVPWCLQMSSQQSTQP